MNRVKICVFLVFMIATSTFSQGPVLELRTETVNNNESITIGNLRPQGAALDVNGDGVRDLAILSPRDPATGQATGIIVKSGNSNQTWVYPFGSIINTHTTYFDLSFVGFYEMNNSSPEKEAILARKNGRSLIDPIILNQVASYNVDFKDVLISSISDIDDDGIDELQLYNKQTGFLEIWGLGPKLELYPANFSVDNFVMQIDSVDIDTILVVDYITQVNGQKRNLHYRFLKNNSVDIAIENEDAQVLLNYNSADNFQIPDGTDEAAAWLAEQNLIKNTSIGLAALWLEFKDSFSEGSKSAVSSVLGSIGGIIGIIPGIVDILCKSNGTATCTDDFGTVTINCTCGVPTCVTQQVTVTVRIRETNPSTGEVTEREEIQTKEKCVCTCLKLKETQ